MNENSIEIQKLTFFTEGNTFTGSKTKETGEIIRFLISPDKENDCLRAFYWNEDLCFEVVENRTQKSFPLSDEGLDMIGKWLSDAYDAL